jgi:signal transduction histidine kinase
LNFNGQDLRLVVARDISEQHELRERLAEALHQTESMLEKERELGALKTRFVSMASHEFRTPLSTIQTSVELLAHYADRLTPEERRESTTAIQQSVDRMRSLMENFLTLGRMGVSFAGCNLQACDLGAVLRQVAAQVRSADGLRHAMVVVQAEASTASPLQLMLDLDFLGQIVGNLLTNACKYSAAHTTVTLRWGKAEDSLLLEVIDEGMGIPEADVPRLFETFHRASNVAGIQGSGLGLAIVKRAVDAHGGSLDVKSELGVGSCFTVRLPWQVAAA